MTEIIDSLPVRRVRRVLAEKGVKDILHELPENARSARDAARLLSIELGEPGSIEVGAVGKTLVYEIGFRPVMVVIAGDRRCNEEALPQVFGLEGEVRRADPRRVEEVTGFPVGGVAPVGSLTAMPVAVDPALGRYPRIFVGAGHPRVLIELTYDDLLHLTDGRPAPEVAL